MKQEFFIIIGLIAIYAIYSRKDYLKNLTDKNIYISNTNLLYKRAKETLLEKNVIKKGNKIYIYEINKLRSNGKLIKTMEINKIPIKIKTKNAVKYAKVPLKIEIQKDLK